MSLALDVGGHFCRAAYMPPDLQPRLVDLSAPLPVESREVAERAAVRPLPSLWVRQGQQVYLGETALNVWSGTADARHAGTALAPLLGEHAQIPGGYDALVHYVARRAAGASERQFQMPVNSLWVAAREGSLEQQKIVRACKLAGLTCTTVSAERAVAAHLGLTGTRRCIVVNWSSTRFEVTCLEGEALAPVPPWDLPGAAGSALLAHALDALRVEDTTAPLAVATARSRAVQRLVKDICSSPASLLGFEDAVTLIGDRTDVLPVAGIRRLLVTELRRRFAQARDSLQRWLAAAGAPSEAVLIGGVAKNVGLATEISALFQDLQITLTVPRAPENVVVNGLALMSSRP